MGEFRIGVCFSSHNLLFVCGETLEKESKASLQCRLQVQQRVIHALAYSLFLSLSLI